MENGILKNKTIYDTEFKSKGGNYSDIYEPVLDLIIDIIKKNNYRKILDYGCGDGRFGFYFKKRTGGRNLIGSDISKEGLVLCSKLYDETHLTDGVTLPDKKFDFIILNSVLEHVPLNKWDYIFSEINKKLEIGGSLFIIFPNINSPLRKFTKRWENEESKLGHIGLVGLKYLNNKLKEYKFINCKLSFIFIVRNLPSYLSCPIILRDIVKVIYTLINIYPFYYLRDSFWILARSYK